MKHTVISNPEGKLLALDVYGCSFQVLNCPEFLIREATLAAHKAGMRVLAITMVPFEPQGLSLVLILGESHLTIHTAPEFGYAGVDVYTCGGGNPMAAVDHLLKVLNPDAVRVKEQRRGMFPVAEEMQLRSNTVAR